MRRKARSFIWGLHAIGAASPRSALRQGTSAMTDFIADRAIYERVIRDAVPKTDKRLWIATADIKDMYVDGPGKEMVPFVGVMAGLLRRGVEIRLIHAKEPGPMFRRDFDRYPLLWTQLERLLCPRVHFKCVIIDGALAYFGSANLTGAGMGAKSGRRRNFENGVFTDDPRLINPLSEQFDAVWRGACCADCGRRQFCADAADQQ